MWRLAKFIQVNNNDKLLSHLVLLLLCIEAHLKTHTKRQTIKDQIEVRESEPNEALDTYIYARAAAAAVGYDTVHQHYTHHNI